MRLLMTSLVAAGLLAGPVRAAECLRNEDHVAVDVTTLKTLLMVTALTCQADEKYNAFIRKYQADLQREDRSLNAYFTRTYGRNSAKQRDDYVTQLANAQSSLGLKQGSLFCDANLPAFDEVMALRNNAELASYAAGREITQPANVSQCGGGATTASTGGRRTTSHATARHRS